MSMLTIRKLADKSEGVRIPRYDPTTGEKYLVDPNTGVAGGWPLAGVRIEGETPRETTLSTDFVANGRNEGWIAVDGERVEHASGGPEGNPWAITHTFVCYDTITVKTVDGDVVYRVTQNPGKDEGEVRWFYKLALEA